MKKLFPFSSAESRLLNVIADPNAVKFTRRTAAANAALQAQAHQQVLAQNQASGQALPAISAANPKAVTSAELRAQQMSTAPMVDQFGNPTAAGVMNQAQRTAQIPGQTTYSMETGAVTQGGQINAGAAQRLIDSGMTVGQAQDQVDANKPEIQRTMSNTGLGGTARKTAVEALKDGPGPAELAYVSTIPQGSAPDPNLIAQARNQDKQAAILQDQQDQQKQSEAKAKANESAAASANSAAGASQPISPQDAGFDAALAGLPPEYQTLAPLFKGLVGSIEKSQSDLAAAQEELLANNRSASQEIEERLTKAEQAQAKASETIQGFIDQALEQESKLLAQQETASKERLEWNRLQQEQTIATERRKARESKIAQMALKNRTGSDGALRELDEADQFYQQQWQNLQMEVGVQRTELAAKFSGLFLEAENKHVIATIQNIKDALGAVERIGAQKNTNTRAMADAESSILQTMIGKQIDLRKELAKEKLNIGGQIIQTINQARDDKRAQEQLGWQQLEWTFKTFGGANAPKSLVDSIAKMLPGVDVSDALQKMTLAEMKKKTVGGGVGSGGRGPSFSSSERSASGKPLSLDAYMSQKESQWRKGTGISGVSPPADLKKRWENEYKAKEAEEKVYSPEAIWNDWLVKQAQSGNFGSVAQMESTRDSIKTAIDSKDYPLARKLVDEIGAKPPEKTIARISALDALDTDLDQMISLVDEIEQNIGPFPTEGPLWAWMNENIETTPQYAKMKQLRDSNLARYSRGVSGETGASTENDVARAVSSLISEKVSAPALKAALQQAKRQASTARTIYVDNMRKGGYRVNSLQTGAESSGTPLPILTPEQQSFLNKF